MFTGLKRNYKKLVKSGLLFNLLKVRFLGTSCPTLASWNLTNRCNQRCLNCRFWDRETPELETGPLLTNIDRLFQARVRFVIFTGGEPLLRDDAERIISYAYSKGMYVALGTNARLLKQKIGVLESLDELHLSLDGPEGINDYLRGEGSFKCTVEAIDLAKRQQTPTFLTTVLSKDNLECIDFLLGLARYYKVKIGFQPASLTYLGISEHNPLSPATKGYKEAISYLIRCKLNGDRHIINSITGLRHIYHFPEEKKLACCAGRLMMRVEADGNIFPCDWGLEEKKQRGIKTNDILHHTHIGIDPCGSCWRYNAVELNLIGSFRLEPILNAVGISW